MTIKLRSLKRSPTGRENIRERIIDGLELSIGRASSCDLELPALIISLSHAIIKQDADGGIRLILLNDSRATVNRRMFSGRSVPIKSGDRIRLGPYSLTIDKPKQPGELTLTYEQVDPEEVVVSGKDETAVFDLTGTLPSKRIMSWIGASVILGLFLILPILAFSPSGKLYADKVPIQSDLAWNSGPISLQHSNLKNDCKTCHVEPFKTVEDKTCLNCHKSTFDHASVEDMRRVEPTPSDFDARLNAISEKFARPIDRCSSCHVEHNTRAHLMPSDPNMCADCHRDMDKVLPDTPLLNVAGFGNDHPQFRPTITIAPDFNVPRKDRISLDDNPRGFSGLKFPHKLHLDKSGGPARMAGLLGERYGFSDGIDCADCHRPEAGGALFDPVNMQQDCAMCHSLGFEDDDGYLRTLRHGEPEEVIASMRDFYLAKALANIRDAEMNSSTRRRPGRAARIRDLNRREIAFKQADERTAAKVEAIFSEGGACFDCHAIEKPEDLATLKYRIKPIYVDSAFYPKARFNHKSHEASIPECESCHAAKASGSSSDILLPKIKICRDCHIGEEAYRKGGKVTEGTFPTTCLTCHTYHSGPNGSLMSIELNTIDAKPHSLQEE